jgi:hypothetical protein
MEKTAKDRRSLEELLPKQEFLPDGREKQR